MSDNKGREHLKPAAAAEITQGHVETVFIDSNKLYIIFVIANSCTLLFIGLNVFAKMILY